MTQQSLDFAPILREHDQEIHTWVNQHNQKVAAAARTATHTSGSLLVALDASDAKQNAVYLLRGVLGQVLRKSMGAPASPSKRLFLKALRAEISMKRSSQDSVFTLRDVLMKTNIPS